MSRVATAAPSFRRDPALPFQTLDGEVIVVDPKTREVHLLNETAARIWTLLADAQTVFQLVATLQQEYDATEEQLRAEVETFVDDMSHRHLCLTVDAGV